MQKLLWIGSPFVAKDMEKCGWDLRFHNFEHTAVFYWQDLLEIADGPPDVLLVADKSRPPFILGMEDFPCLTVFYCVDSHIHSYYPYYAQGFDVCLVSLKDHIANFQNLVLPDERVIHAPAFAKDDDLPPSPESFKSESIDAALSSFSGRDWDLLFVGTVNSDHTPCRNEFMQALSGVLPNFAITKGNYRELYPKAKIVLNHCELGDLNFRVFEALGCGSTLLTPLVGHGLDEMFELEKDLFTYRMNDWGDALNKVRALLANPRACIAAAKSGFAKVNANHRAIRRAEALTYYLLSLGHEVNASPYRKYEKEDPDYQRIISQRHAKARVIHQDYLKLIYLLLADKIDDPLLKESYLEAAKGG
jgi:hypothetical protein